VAGRLFDGAIDQALETAATVNAICQSKNPRIAAAILYAFARRSIARGETIVSSHKACADGCDKLSESLVTLSRSGAVGPMLRGKDLDPEVLKDGRVQKAVRPYLRSLDPKHLPWRFFNESVMERLAKTA
jgi:hypothetical protein